MSDLKPYRITGRFVMGRGWQPFSKELVAKDEAECAEITYSVLGSNHGVKRKFIRITKIEKIKKIEDVEDPRVRDILKEVAK